MEKEPTIWENISAENGSSPKYIKNSQDSTPGTQNNPIKKWGKDLNRHFRNFYGTINDPEQLLQF